MQNRFRRRSRPGVVASFHARALPFIARTRQPRRPRGAPPTTAIGEGPDDEQSPSGLCHVVCLARRAEWQPVEAGVDQLDPKRTIVTQDQPEAEVAAWHASVLHGIHGQLAHDMCDFARRLRIVGPAPLRELLYGEAASEPCTASSARELRGELTTPHYGGTFDDFMSLSVSAPSYAEQ